MARFTKGQSGNPEGRPRGSKDKRRRFREAFEHQAPAIVEAIINKALTGDPTAMRICAERLCPPIKPQEDPIRLERFGKTSAEQAERVLQAMAQGRLTPTEAQTVLACIQAKLNILEASELAERLERIEQHLAARGIDGQDPA